MTHVALPDNAASQLTAAEGPVSITDSSGRILGTFIPFDAELYARNRSPLTPEERRRRRESRGGMTLPEFWAEMRERYPDEFQ
jgi:hypothetical protein